MHLPLRNFYKKLKNIIPTDRYWLAFSLSLIFMGMFIVFTPVMAQESVIASFTRHAIGGFVEIIVDVYLYFVGALLTSILIPVLVGVAKYNDFIANPIVLTGWALVRDLANIFFVIVLLIIAFSTMLRLQTYHYKQALAKLILMIILINFSKLISGLLIDFFQVVMMTFVDGFANTLGGNFIAAFHIYDMLAFAQTSVSTGGASASTAEWSVTGALILAAVGITVVTMTVLIMIAVLLYRMVMLWILVVLSPLAYFAYTIRPSYWSQWWSEFFKNLVSGPVIAFFLWLALLTAQGSDPILGKGFAEGIDPGEGLPKLMSGFAVPSVMLNFMAMTALMIAGLVVSQKIASQSGSVVGNFANKVRSVGTKAMMLGTGAFVGKKAYDWGSRRVKAYQGMKENIKNKRAGEFAQNVMNAKGWVKDQTIGRTGRGLKSVYDTATGKNRRDRTEKEAAEKQRIYEELQAMPTPQDATQVDEHTTKLAEAEAAAKAAQIKANRAVWLNRVATGAVAIGGAALGGIATGGLGAVGVVSGMGMGLLAHKGARVGLQKLAESGQAEQKAAKYMQVEKINNHRRDFADKSINDLKTIFDDAGKSDDEKMAAMIELVSRGFADDGQIPAFRSFMERNGDKYTKDIFENEVAKNNQSMAINRDGLSKSERIRAGIEKPEDWNASSILTNTEDILDGHMDTVDTPSGSKQIFNGKKLLASINHMSMTKQQSMLNALAKVIEDGSKQKAEIIKAGGEPEEVKTKLDAVDSRVNAAEEILIAKTRFDKIPKAHLDSMSPNKIVSHMLKNEKEFVASVVENPDVLTPDVLIHMQKNLPKPKFNKIWEKIEGIEASDGNTIGVSTLNSLLDKIKSQDSKSGGLDVTSDENKELVKDVATFTVLTGKFGNVADPRLGLSDKTKQVILDNAAVSERLRVQELSGIGFNEIDFEDKDGNRNFTPQAAVNFKNDILINKKSYDIESAFNKQVFDKGNADKITPLINYMKEVVDKSLANQPLDFEGTTPADVDKAVQVKKSVLDAVYKFLQTPNSTLGKEFIDYQDKLKEIKEKRVDLNR